LHVSSLRHDCDGRHYVDLFPRDHGFINHIFVLSQVVSRIRL
jgi:hypothetical protein